MAHPTTGAPKAKEASRVQLNWGLLDLQRGVVTNEHREVPLGKRELAILRLLASQPKRAFSRQDLRHLVWSDTGSLRTVDVAIARIRRKLERCPDEPEHLRTVQGVGYAFHPLSSRNPALPVVSRGRMWGAETRKQLQDLRSLFRESQLVAVVGLVGSGKTRLAAEFVSSYGDRWSAVRWFDGQGGLATAKALGFLGCTAHHETIRRCLGEHQGELWVLDGVVAQGATKGPAILVTSRVVGSLLRSIVRSPTLLDDRSAVGLLREHTPVVFHHRLQESLKAVRALDCHPASVIAAGRATLGCLDPSGLRQALFPAVDDTWAGLSLPGRQLLVQVAAATCSSARNLSTQIPEADLSELVLHGVLQFIDGRPKVPALIEAYVAARMPVELQAARRDRAEWLASQCCVGNDAFVEAHLPEVTELTEVAIGLERLDLVLPLLQARQRAGAGGAGAVVTRQVQQALPMAHEQPVRDQLLALLAWNHGRLGEMDEAQAALDDIEVPTPQTRWLQGTILVMAGKAAEARGLWLEGTVVEDSPPTAEAARILSVAGLALEMAGHSERGGDLLLQALGRSRTIGTQRDVARALARLAVAHHRQWKHDEAERCLREGLEQTTHFDDPWTEAMLYQTLGSVLADRTEYPQSEDYFKKAWAIYDGLDAAKATAALKVDYAPLLAETNRPELALRYIEEARRELVGMGPMVEGPLCLVLGCLRHRLGFLAEARALIDLAVAMGQGTDQHFRIEGLLVRYVLYGVDADLRLATGLARQHKWAGLQAINTLEPPRIVLRLAQGCFCKKAS